MSEKMPSSAPAETAETKGELSEEQEQTFGRRIIRVFSALHEKITGRPKMSEEERVLAAERKRLDEDISSLSTRREAAIAHLQDQDLDDHSRLAAEADVETKSIRIMNLQLQRMRGALPSPLSAMMIDSLDANRNSELTLGMSTGRIDKIVPKMTEIADGQASPEDLQKTLGDLSGPVTQERVSEVRLFLRAEPFAKAMTGDFSDFSELGSTDARLPVRDAELIYDRSYRNKLQKRLESEDLSDLERQAIQAEIQDAEERIARVEARIKRETEAYQAASRPANEPEPARQPDAWPTPEPEPSFSLGAQEASNPDAFSQNSPFWRATRDRMRSEMRDRPRSEMQAQVKREVMEKYEQVVEELQQSIDRKGDTATPEEIQRLNSRKDALARSRASFISYHLPLELQEAFEEATDFDTDPTKREERFVLPILVEVVRGHFDLDSINSYLEEAAGDMPQEKRDQILQKYRVFLQALLDNNQ